jgi:hypothetical protein
LSPEIFQILLTKLQLLCLLNKELILAWLDKSKLFYFFYNVQAFVRVLQNLSDGLFAVVLHSSILQFEVVCPPIDQLLISGVSDIIDRNFRLIIVIAQTSFFLYLCEVITYIPQMSRVIFYLFWLMLYLS